MDRKIKLAAAISLVGLSAAACAPNPYWQYPGYTTNRSTTAVSTTAGTNKAPVTHSHNGKVHTHPLPPEGLAHTHNMGAPGQANYAYNQPPQQSNTYYNPPPATNTTTYGYTDPNSSYNYNYSAPATTNTGSYFDYSAPKNNTSGYVDYSGGTSNSGTYYNYSSTPTTPRSTASVPTSSGDSYIVQKGDTVFQVMRNTGVYWKDIIRLNNLQAPDYTLQPGQRLILK